MSNKSNKNLKSIYRTIIEDKFPENMEISFYNDSSDKQTLFYKKAYWNIGGEEKGLRYGENPNQEAALYKLENGNLVFGDVKTIIPGNYLASNIELLQSGKHPGKTNITDIDNALNILRYFSDSPVTVIVKHNNPCGVAKGKSLSESYTKALMADRIAAFGGAIAVNRALDMDTARLIIESYSEVVAAPDFEEGVLELLSQKKNLRVMKIDNIYRLNEWVGKQFVDFKSLIDGGIITQMSYVPVLSKDNFFPAECTYKEKKYTIERAATEDELDDMLFGWLIESGITSNSVIFVKDGATIGIGTGEQDRVGVAEIARDKAYRKYADRICFEKYNTPLGSVTDKNIISEINKITESENGGLKNSIMVSDAFFPFRDGIDIGLCEGVSAVIQPGGSLNDYQSIEACNEYGAAMMFTGQRSFKH